MTTTPYLFRKETPAALEADINAVFNSILTEKIIGVEVDAVRNSPYFAKNIYAAITTTDDSASVITNPFVFKTFVSSSEFNARKLMQDFMLANITYFFTPVWVVYRPLVDNPEQSTIIAVFYNVNYAEGFSNWGFESGGVPGGPAGGDLGGSYPNPTVPAIHENTAALIAGTNVVITLPIASVGDLEAEIEFVKGAVRYSSHVRANHDGVTAYYTEDGIVLTPGTIDVAVDVVVTGANLELRAIASSGGWTINYRSRSLAD